MNRHIVPKRVRKTRERKARRARSKTELKAKHLDKTTVKDIRLRTSE